MHQLSSEFRYRNRKSSVIDISTKNGTAKIWAAKSSISADARKTIEDLTKCPDVYPYIAIMHDFHINGSWLNGSIIPTRNSLFVTAVGGDLGCGMASLKLPIQTDDIEGSLKAIYKEIYATVPCGRRTNETIDDAIENHPVFNHQSDVLTNDVRKKAKRQLGTLGGGNHFIEIQKNEEGELNIMVHTGSRYLGQVIRSVHLKNGTELARPHGLVTLAADSPEGQKYLNDMSLAIDYAKENRTEILRRVYAAIAKFVPELQQRDFSEFAEDTIDIHHNYIAQEEHFGETLYVHRKGAIHLLEGEVGIVPGSMGSKSYLVMGRGNIFSFNSCAHGAGRKLSRREAFNGITPRRFRQSMGDVISRTDRNVFDEAPEAYKDIEGVMRSQRDLVKVSDVLYPLASIKG